MLAGGTGSRLRPLTQTIPKQLLPIANTPVLRHCLEQLRTLGVTDVGVVVGRFGGQIRAAFGDGADLGLRVRYLTQDRPAGLADCVRLAGDFLGDDDFVMYLGDNVLVGDLRPALRRFRETRSDAHLLVTAVPDPRAYGVADLAADGTVRAVAEKSPDPPSDLAIIGVYWFTAAVHRAVRRIRPSARGELEITDAIQHLIDDGRPVTAQRFHGAWRDAGSVTALLDCNRLLLSDLRGAATPATTPDAGRDTRTDAGRDAGTDAGRDAGTGVGPGTVVHGPVRVDPGARVVRSRLVGPVVVGAGSVVVDSLVGPDVAVGAGCGVTGAVVRDAILLPGAVVDGGAPVVGAVVGPGRRVTPGRTAPVPAATGHATGRATAAVPQPTATP
ncbi:sugar phosphate nucleotidyltransferase [Dactylosporangium aurantiacum]|uniref:sugar phosphate nucleotidyltransferase n=1 Tax=Dactylosporangium aurantiacum TaxID=35754 RepID=UPI000A980C64|nr:sugar phosphate nucleotidyltransferase [Dactylosporangium aurantiacum]MDG6101799.1 sugar phosphate nucleotidyltransferase [Dactylosporangium aurantiacum]